ncbi:MAG: hypothetical protein K2I81_03320 [Alphaproteobacteria bacterium]|nr:hypothetical protein [Alphaproteobacteria bacterium]
MKKTLLIAGMIAAPISMAVAKTINFDTPVEWNSKVVEQALNKAGFIGGSGANWDVRVTHDRILTELLNRKSFSLKDATQVCLNKCNMSDFLKNGRGSSGKKCPELCKGFTDSLTSVNNSLKNAAKSTGSLEKKQSNGIVKIWTKDKKYYSVIISDSSMRQKYKNVCDAEEGWAAAVVFITQSNKAIGLLTYSKLDDNLYTLCVQGSNNYFVLKGLNWGWNEKGGIDVFNSDSAYLDY